MLSPKAKEESMTTMLSRHNQLSTEFKNRQKGAPHWRLKPHLEHFYFVGLHAKVMIKRDSWGYSYSIVRGGILGFMEDELLQLPKHLPRMFSLIKNES